MRLIASVMVSLVLWTAYLCLLIPLILVGVPICYVLAKRRVWIARKSRYYARTIDAWRPSWAWLWGNEENGVTGPAWWLERRDDDPLWWSAFTWTAQRNPVNNLRFVPVLHPVINPARIRFVGNADDPAEHAYGEPNTIEWAYTWHGLYAGLVWRWQIKSDRHAQIRIGWKLIPRDRKGLPADDHRRVRCPFGVQVHVWRRSTV